MKKIITVLIAYFIYGVSFGQVSDYTHYLDSVYLENEESKAYGRFHYDEDGHPTSFNEFVYNDDLEVWLPGNSNQFFYSDGLLISEVLIYEIREDQEIPYAKKMDVTYDDNGEVVETVKYIQQEESGSYEKFLRTTFEIDNEGEVFKRRRYDWDEEWILEEVETRYYDFGNRLEKLVDSIFTPENLEHEVTIVDFTYDSIGGLLTSESASFDNGLEVYGESSYYDYSVDGKEIEKIDSIFFFGEEYVSGKQVLVTSEDSSSVENLAYYWDNALESFVPFFQYSFSNNLNIADDNLIPLTTFLSSDEDYLPDPLSFSGYAPNFALLFVSNDGLKFNDTASLTTSYYYKDISSHPLSTFEANEVKQLSFYPNPVNTIMNLETDGQLTILNLSGDVVYSQEVQETNRRVDLASLSTGVYVVNLVSSEGKFTSKLVKD